MTNPSSDTPAEPAEAAPTSSPSVRMTRTDNKVTVEFHIQDLVNHLVANPVLRSASGCSCKGCGGCGTKLEAEAK